MNVRGMPVGDGTGFDEQGGVGGVQAGRHVPEPRPHGVRWDSGDAAFELFRPDLERLRQDKKDDFRTFVQV
ncbi:hypothetical protein D9M72_617060 [compost metagenome]